MGGWAVSHPIWKRFALGGVGDEEEEGGGDEDEGDDLS